MATAAAFTSHILVPVDGSQLSEQAIASANGLAGPATTLYLLRVTPHAVAASGLFGAQLL